MKKKNDWLKIISWVGMALIVYVIAADPENNYMAEFIPLVMVLLHAYKVIQARMAILVVSILLSLAYIVAPSILDFTLWAAIAFLVY